MRFSISEKLAEMNNYLFMNSSLTFNIFDTIGCAHLAFSLLFHHPNTNLKSIFKTKRPGKFLTAEGERASVIRGISSHEENSIRKVDMKVHWILLLLFIIYSRLYTACVVCSNIYLYWIFLLSKSRLLSIMNSYELFFRIPPLSHAN